jgi:hypothetical protein
MNPVIAKVKGSLVFKTFHCSNNPQIFIHQYLFVQLEYFCDGKQPKFEIHRSQGFGFKKLPGINNIVKCLINVQ